MSVYSPYRMMAFISEVPPVTCSSYCVSQCGDIPWTPWSSSNMTPPQRCWPYRHTLRFKQERTFAVGTWVLILKQAAQLLFAHEALLASGLKLHMFAGQVLSTYAIGGAAETLPGISLTTGSQHQASEPCSPRSLEGF